MEEESTAVVIGSTSDGIALTTEYYAAMSTLPRP